MSWRTIRANACRSRTRRAMSWTYCAPKSRTRTGRDVEIRTRHEPLTREKAIVSVRLVNGRKRKRDPATIRLSVTGHARRGERASCRTSVPAARPRPRHHSRRRGNVTSSDVEIDHGERPRRIHTRDRDDRAGIDDQPARGSETTSAGACGRRPAGRTSSSAR